MFLLKTQTYETLQKNFYEGLEGTPSLLWLRLPVPGAAQGILDQNAERRAVWELSERQSSSPPHLGHGCTGACFPAPGPSPNQLKLCLVVQLTDPAADPLQPPAWLLIYLVPTDWCCKLSLAYTTSLILLTLSVCGSTVLLAAALPTQPCNGII